jgi:hypothetical protein
MNPRRHIEVPTGKFTLDMLIASTGLSRAVVQKRISRLVQENKVEVLGRLKDPKYRQYGKRKGGPPLGGPPLIYRSK